MMCRFILVLSASSLLGLLLVPTSGSAQNAESQNAESQNAESQCGESQSGKKLRWNMSAGDQLQVAIKQTSNQRMQLANRQIRTLTEMEMFLDWSIEEVDEDGGATINQTITRLKLNMNVSGSESVQYDSASTQPPLGAAADIASKIQPIIGSQMEIKMSPRGEIVAGNLPQFVRSAVESNPDHPFAKLFSGDGVRGILGQSAIVLPDQELQPGDTWSQSNSTPSPVGDLQQEHTYTYVGTNQVGDRSLEQIQVETKLKINSNSPSTSKLKMTDHAQTGTVQFDTRLGRVVKSEQTQEMTTETPYRDTMIRVTVESSSVYTIRPAEQAEP